MTGPIPAPAPSAPLSNVKHETFCQSFAASNNATTSYLTAYPKTKPAAAAASANRLLKRADVAARIAGLRAGVVAQIQAAGERGVREVIDRLWRLADYPDVRALYETDPDMGWLQLKPVEEWPPELAFAVEGMELKNFEPVRDRDTGEVLRPAFQLVKLKLAGRKAPLELLGRIHGAFPKGDGPPVDPNDPNSINGVHLHIHLPGGAPWREPQAAVPGKVPVELPSAPQVEV